MLKQLFLSLACVLGIYTTGLSQNEGSITIQLTDMKADNSGQLVFLLFNDADGFPNEQELAVQKASQPKTASTATFTFKNIPYGKYAVAVFWDKNDNGELDRNLLGIPKEPVGASNMVSFGRPNFSKCAFELTGSSRTITLQFIND